jgi:hypothetical protein
MTKLTNPTPLWLDARGTLLDAGYIYVGVAQADPEDQPIQLYANAARTIPLAQPLRTLGGVVVNGATRTGVFMAEDDYSLRVRDADGNLISYEPSAVETQDEQYQPLDSDLTAIAALATTPYGRSLLTLANQAALKAATGIPDPLPAAGGTVTGNISRSGAGGHAYAAKPAYAAIRVFGPEDTTDPTSQPGDIWFKPNG